MKQARLTTPCTSRETASFKSGDILLLSGEIYTARDAAHNRMLNALARGEALPFNPQGAAIFYCGPSPTPPGKIFGSGGPTSSYRMDAYTPPLLDLGVKILIGKGGRGPEVRASLRKNQALYLAATGGAGALLAQCVREVTLVDYQDLGPEAIRRLIVKDMPLICVNDGLGNDLYEQGRQAYRRGL